MNIRPIILLEAFRKTVVRVINKRLSQILIEHNVLKGPNYAGLPGDPIKKVDPCFIFHVFSVKGSYSRN